MVTLAAESCEVCGASASVVDADVQYMEPVQDSKGDWWKVARAFGLPHFRCGEHPRVAQAFDSDGNLIGDLRT